jgi:hypothetical protein
MAGVGRGDDIGTGSPTVCQCLEPSLTFVHVSDVAAISWPPANEVHDEYYRDPQREIEVDIAELPVMNDPQLINTSIRC